jgi:hypothetical protein
MRCRIKSTLKSLSPHSLPAHFLQKRSDGQYCGGTWVDQWGQISFVIVLSLWQLWLSCSIWCVGRKRSASCSCWRRGSLAGSWFGVPVASYPATNMSVQSSSFCERDLLFWKEAQRSSVLVSLDKSETMAKQNDSEMWLRAVNARNIPGTIGSSFGFKHGTCLSLVLHEGKGGAEATCCPHTRVFPVC